MAESLVFGIAKNVLGKIASFAYEEFSMAWGFKKDIEKLAKTLSSIKAVLLDAEEQQVHNHELRVWLQNLKDVCYDAEDVLDEFEIEALRRQVVNRRSIRRKVCNFFSSSNPLAFSLMMGHKIKEIKERLNEIAADRQKFNLSEKIDDKPVIIRKETHSFVIASEVIGREIDKEKIINLLKDQTEGENVSVIPIVGIGGVGKTALVKLVYNDERVEKDFHQLRMWVCVSENFDLKQWIMKILKSATNMSYSDLDVDQLQRKLQEQLKGKRYLLVLDDVWSDVREKWIELKTLLKGGAYGSKILVTTRSHRVASIMGTVSAYILGVLPHDVCLSLFVKCAFREGQENQHTNLIKIGEEIVKKCGGIPLAVRTLGSLLYSSTNENDWKRMRDNEIWTSGEDENEILPALRLSYDQLPSHLKQCFIYCSIFPKDYVFDTIRLPQFWMAHGLLVQSPEVTEELEVIGMRYLRELWSRSFFQDFVQDYDFFTFKLHDIMHDLAVLMAEGEFLIVDSDRKFKFFSKKVRHLSFVGGNTNISEKEIPSLVSKLGHVRTISFPIDGEVPTQPFAESCISSFQILRVLNLSDSNIEVLPKEIGNLKHLRHFTLERSGKLRKIPNSICKLQSLQTLDLSRCSELEELPKDIQDLIGLRAFAFTTKQNCLQENGIGCLNSLRVLGILFCQNLEYLFEDIGNLQALRTLGIVGCSSLMLLPHSMKYLSSLENLVLRNCEKLNLDLTKKSEWENKHQRLLNHTIITRPHLKVLVIGEILQLVELPQWLLEAFANTLQRLSISNCRNFITMPDPLQCLRSLQILSIETCPKLSSLPEDIRYLTALKKLKITGCPVMIERCMPGIGEDWPKIAHIPVIEFDGATIKSPDH